MNIASNQKSVGLLIEDVHLSFGDTKVLEGVNLQIAPGEFFAFLGPSGSGKSTLLRAIAGFGPRPQGRILIDGDDVLSIPAWKRNVGMVFQSYALWPHMTVRKNVAFGLEERKLPQTEIQQRVEQALDLVGLLHLADRRPSQLSGGQQQRIALARTIVVEPRVLLLDEPLSNLDAKLRVQMRRDILDLQRKLELTTIFVTHDQEEANTVSDRMAVLDKGVIQQVGAPMNLYDQPVNLFVAEFLGTANIVRGEVTANDDRSWFTGEDGWHIQLPQSLKAGGQGALVFRPQNVAVSAADEQPRESELFGEIEYREFLGSVLRYGVKVGANRVLIDEHHRQGVPPLQSGQTVKLSVDADSLAWIPR